MAGNKNTEDSTHSNQPLKNVSAGTYMAHQITSVFLGNPDAQEAGKNFCKIVLIASKTIRNAMEFYLSSIRDRRQLF